ncbi:helix-turn-helix domain-containing protein [Alicyclobacillus fodiniaquatilis]|uniref:Helix-turn-helix domain-containing protein n=1 Tax=Alicyclobacillus fodiniaquatilis TaxID=1661150 RepID=A0ABW4JDV2_9BACL
MIGQKIKQLRLEMGISQEKLIHGLFDRTYLSQIERGLKVPPRETLEKLAERLGIPVHELTEYSETTERISTMLSSARETKNLATIREAWETALKVQSIEQMGECVLAWASIAAEQDATSVDLLDAINHVLMLMSNTAGPESSLVLQILMIRANTYYYLGMFDQAVWAYRSLEIRHPPDELLGRVKVSLGSSLMALMRYEEALQQFSEALIVVDITDLTRARAHQGVGGCSRYLRLWEQAIQHLEKACVLFAGLEEEYRYVLTRHSLGILLLDKFEFDKARTIFAEVQTFYIAHEMSLHLAELYEEMARIEFYKKNYQRGNTWCNRGLKLLDGLNGPLAGRLFLWKCWSFYITGKTALAEDAWQAARSLLNAQLKMTIDTLDPNMTEETKKMFHDMI